MSQGVLSSHSPQFLPRVFVMLIFFCPVYIYPEDVSTNEFWDNSFDQAVESGKREERWILVYFPSALDENDPSQVRKFLPSGPLASRILGARVRATEVQQLIQKFKIKNLPALVLFDPFANAHHNWEKHWFGKEVLNRIQILDRKLNKLKKCEAE